MKVFRIASFTFFLLTTPVFAGTRWVPDDGTIQECINASENGDMIIVRPGTYAENISFFGKAITIKSEQGPTVTTISGVSGSGSVVAFIHGEDRSSVIMGFTITNGNSDDTFYGGGIVCWNSSPSIIGNLICYNRASWGGGIGCYGDFRSEPVIVNNDIHHNEAIAGGGLNIYLYSDYYPSRPIISNNLIHHNMADGGWAYGGGVLMGNENGDVLFEPTFENNTIVDNGAMFYVPGGEGGGAGVYFWANCTAPLENCVIYRNDEGYSLPDLEVEEDMGNDVVVRYCDIEAGWPGDGNIDADPMFAPGPCGDYYLSQTASGQGANSPCVDAGDPASAMISGTTRTDEVPDACVVDMGFHYPPYNPAADIKVNGGEGLVEVTPADPVTVTISLDPGSLDGTPADWWVAALRPKAPKWWAKYRPGQMPEWTKSDPPIRFVGAKLRVVDGYVVLGPQTLPLGDYVFGFAVDDDKDGVFDGTFMDTIEVAVNG